MRRDPHRATDFEGSGSTAGDASRRGCRSPPRTHGRIWTLQPPLTAGSATDLIYHDGEYVLLLGASGQIYTSRDLQSWSWRTLAYADDVRALAFCNGHFMAVGANALILQANP